MTLISIQTFENGTNGSNLTNTLLNANATGWSLGSGGQSGVYSTAAATHGSLGVDYTSLTTFGYSVFDNGSTIPIMLLSCYFEFPTAMPTINEYVNSVGITSGANNADWRVNTAGTVTIRNASVAAATSVPTLTTGTVYRAEWLVNSSTSTQELKIFVGESTTALIDISGTYTAGAPEFARFGIITASSATEMYIDTLRVADTWIGPYVTTPALPGSIISRPFTYDFSYRTMHISLWNGSAELAIKSITVWNGTSEVAASLSEVV